MSLEVRNVVSGYYRDVDVLHDFSMRAEKSKITCVVGPNGAGKSTLLRTIYGFLKPKRGSIIYNGEDITGFRPHILLKKGIAYILQRRSVFPFMTVHENLLVGAWTIRKDKDVMEEAIREVYERFPRLKERRDVKASLLSGGEQRMLELSRALLRRPDFLLLDEPSAGLAPKVANELYGKLAELRDEGMTIILVDQNIRQAVNLSDYIYVVELGRNKMDGPKGRFEADLAELIKTWLI
ncbi:MAG: ABC transporter ATP-binding protein [Candidatus Geothermarchaeales archaeon]